MKDLEVMAQNSVPNNSKPTYKEYQKFLQTYNDNKSDRSTSPTALSTNSSTSSVPSMTSESDNMPVAFNEYLQSYGSKRFSTVRPNLPKKNVKTELFVQVSGDDKESLHSRKYNTLRTRKTPGKIILARQNSLNKCDSLKNSMLPAGHQVVLSPPPAKQDVVPDNLIYAKTAVLNELSTKPPKLHKSPPPISKSSSEIINSVDVSSLPPPLPKSTPPLLISKSQSEIINSIGAPSIPPPPPPPLSNFTTSKTFPINISVKKVEPTSIQPKPSQNRPSFISEMQNKFKENSQNRLPSELPSAISGKKSPPLNNTILPPPPKFLNEKSVDLVDRSGVSGVKFPPNSYIPPPPKFSELNNRFTKSPPLTNSTIPPPAKFNELSYTNTLTGKKSPPMSNSSIPPPPPKFGELLTGKKSPPLTNSSIPPPPKFGESLNKNTLTGKKSPPLNNSSIPPPPKFLNQVTKSADLEGNTTTYVPVTDTNTNIDKSNPNVKKLVYNTYRGLLGAYNNKANNMVTMPKNIVVQDQGVTKQLESIELQGCLDKLNGRVNPSGENE